MRIDSKKTSDAVTANNVEMTSRRIDAILAGEEQLVPSSGFLSSVMERVQEEAAAPPPIPFPWKRAVPGMALAVGVFGWGGYELVRQAIPAGKAFALTVGRGDAAQHWNAAVGRPLEQAGWVALALGLSWGSWLFSRRLAGRSGF
jgi:hypothetical protein